MSNHVTYVQADAFRKALKAKESVEGLAVIKSFGTPEVAKAIDLTARILEMCISTGNVDRQDDTIDVNGWDLKNYAANPVVLFAHDQWNPPIAQALATWVENGKLMSRAQFIEREIYPFGFMIFQMYAGKYMRASSVGFKPMEYTMSDERKYGVDFKKQELLEWSCVPVPANADALSEAKSVGKIDLAPMKAWAERWLDECQKHEGRDERVRATVERMRAASDPAGRSLVLALGDLRIPAGVPDTTDTAAKDDDMKADEVAAKVEELKAGLADTVKAVLAEMGITKTAPVAGDDPKGEKAGARHSAADMARLQDAHDKAADLGAVCDDPDADDAKMAARRAKAGKRHSAEDMKLIDGIHKALKDMGAACNKKADDAADEPDADDKGFKIEDAKDGDVVLDLDDEPKGSDELHGISMEEVRDAIRQSMKDALDEAKGKIID